MFAYTRAELDRKLRDLLSGRYSFLNHNAKFGRAFSRPTPVAGTVVVLRNGGRMLLVLLVLLEP